MEKSKAIGMMVLAAESLGWDRGVIWDLQDEMMAKDFKDEEVRDAFERVTET